MTSYAADSSNNHHFLPCLVALFLTCFFALQTRSTGIYTKFQRKRRFTIFNPFTVKPAHEVVATGYNEVIKRYGAPFTMQWWAKDWIILPPKYLPGIRDADPSHLNFLNTISDCFYLHKTVGRLYAGNRMAHVVKRGLSPKLPLLTPKLLEEMDYAFAIELGDPGHGKSFVAQRLLSRIAHRVASRIMVGHELCRNEMFINASLEFVMSLFGTALVICKLPLGPFREVLAGPITLWHASKLNKVEKLVVPVVRDRITDWQAGYGQSEQLDCIQWTLDLMPTEGATDTKVISQELIHNLWAGTSAPGGLVMDMLFQVLLEPHYLVPLRAEAADAVHMFGWSEHTFNHLTLQDSFIREISRLYPTGSITVTRTVYDRPFVFSDGLTLPVATRLAFPAAPILHDESTFPNAKQFDGFRFARQHTKDNDRKVGEKQNSSSSMSTTNLAFGYGTHVCPGRFFAVRMVKMIFTKLILDYDITWEGHVTQRPPPVCIEGQFIPNLKQKIIIKKRV